MGTATNQLSLEEIKQPEVLPETEQPKPSGDLKALIRQEHRQAELQRLDEGYAGCGCAECQELYKTLDLTRYGNRVAYCGELVIIAEKKRQDTDRWSDCGQVQFIDGRGYGITAKGQTVDLGKEEDILRTFTTGEIVSDLCPDRAVVLQGILEYRQEVKDNERTVEVKRPGAFRSRLTGDIKHRKANLRQPSTRKRAAVRKA